MKKIKQKKCRVCKELFTPFNTLATACSMECALVQVKQDNQRKADKDAKALRKRDREAKKRLKSRSDHIKSAQKACNAYVRYRDRDEPCISCGKYDHEIKDVFVGGKWDAGHYKTRGAYPELRFNELNIYRQCKSCNGGSGKWGRKSRTVSSEYEENLIARVGQKIVDWLNGHHETQNWSIEEINWIETYYKAKLKELKNET